MRYLFIVNVTSLKIFFFFLKKISSMFLNCQCVFFIPLSLYQLHRPCCIHAVYIYFTPARNYFCYHFQRNWILDLNSHAYITIIRISQIASFNLFFQYVKGYNDYVVSLYNVLCQQRVDVMKISNMLHRKQVKS